MSTDVRVIYHYEDGTWWADSPNIERWTAAADTVEDLIPLVIDGVSFALDTDDVRLTHVPAPDLMDVFAGRTSGGRVRLRLLNELVHMIDAPEAVLAAEVGNVNVLVAA